MFSCKVCCRNCFPNGCCGFCKPKPQVQRQIDTAIHFQRAVERKEIPYGFINVYPGVRRSDNKYTCPKLAIHLYQRSEHKYGIAHNDDTSFVHGNHQYRFNQGSQKFLQEEKVMAEEEILIIPVEDVIFATAKTEIKTAVQADVNSETIPTYGKSENCCDRCAHTLCKSCQAIRNFCCCCCDEKTPVAPVVINTATIIAPANPNKSTTVEEVELPLPKENVGCCTRITDRFRCWCCRKNILVKLIKRTNRVAGREAQRMVTIIIEYSKYSHLDSASNVRILSQEQQYLYYRDRFQPNTQIKFYLLNDKEYDNKNFEVKKKQAETLCRTIMELKEARTNYPSKGELEAILDESHVRTFGDEFRETTIQLLFNPPGYPINSSQIQNSGHLLSTPTIPQKQITTAKIDAEKKQQHAWD